MNNVFFNKELNLEVRTLQYDDEIYFVGKDVASALGYSNVSDALKKHVDEEDKTQSQNTTELNLGQRGGVIINESGIYSLVLRSTLPSAKKFKRWITKEVIPSIRKTGSYTTEVPDEEVIAEKYLLAVREKKALLLENETLQLENNKKDLEIDNLSSYFAQGITPTQFAKTLYGVNVSVIQNYLASIGYIKKGPYGWQTMSKGRDTHFLDIKKVANEYTTSKVEITRRGAELLFKHYKQGKLQMKKNYANSYKKFKKVTFDTFISDIKQ